MKRFSRLSRFYQRSATYVLGGLLAFVFLNVVIGLAYLVVDAYREPQNPVLATYGDRVERAYTGLQPQQIKRLLLESWSRPYVYEPFTQFKERPFAGTFVNVHEAGFRRTKDQGPWPPDPQSLNVFLFGGSTTFCYGLPDDQTVASHLQDFLRTRYPGAHVYNFGRGSYYSSQERILLEQLLLSGRRPDLAVFIDGLNEFFYHEEKPHFSGALARLMEAEIAAAGPPHAGETASAIGRALHSLPLMRALRAVQYRAGRLLGSDSKQVADQLPDTSYDNHALLDRVIQRYLNNMKLIDSAATTYGVQAVFVWQPVPTYRFDLEEHLFADGGFGRNSYSKYGYPRFARRLEESPLKSNFFWCADMQQEPSLPRYVDKVHYSSDMAKQLANMIYRLLIERRLLPENGQPRGEQ